MLRLLNPILLNVILSFYSFKKYFEDLRVQVHKISNIFTVINMDLPARNVVVQSLSRVWLFVTPWTAASQASLSLTKSWSLLKLMSIKSVMPSNHLILCHPLCSCLQSFPASGSILMSLLFVSGGQSIGTSASASVLPMNIQDWFPLGLMVGSPCSPRDSQESSPIPQFKASILQHSAFFIVQLSHPYMITGKIIALSRWTFVSKVISLLFNMLSRLVITFLPRNKHFLISWLQSPSAVIFRAPKK